MAGTPERGRGPAQSLRSPGLCCWREIQCAARAQRQSQTGAGAARRTTSCPRPWPVARRGEHAARRRRSGGSHLAHGEIWRVRIKVPNRPAPHFIVGDGLRAPCRPVSPLPMRVPTAPREYRRVQRGCRAPAPPHFRLSYGVSCCEAPGQAAPPREPPNRTIRLLAMYSVHPHHVATCAPVSATRCRILDLRSGKPHQCVALDCPAPLAAHACHRCLFRVFSGLDGRQAGSNIDLIT